MSRKKPSGDGNKSRRFAEVTQPDGTTLKVPVVKDAGTFIYLANPNKSWPKKTLATLLYDAAWMVEGVRFELEELAPGLNMGSRSTVHILAVHNIVSLDRTGKYSKFAQVKKLVLITPTANTDDLAELELDDLEAPE